MQALHNSKTNSIFIGGALLCLAYTIFFSIPFASAVTWNVDPIISISVNSSENWDTNLGSLDNASATNFIGENATLAINESWLDSFGSSIWCRLTGCNMTGNLSVDGDISGVTFTLNGTTINSWDDINASGVLDTGIYKIYFNHSMNNFITYNLTKSDVSIITLETVSGQKEIYGDQFT